MEVEGKATDHVIHLLDIGASIILAPIYYVFKGESDIELTGCHAGGDVTMSKEKFAYRFYMSIQWKRCRAEYLRKVGGLCERCLSDGMYVPAEEVHHKVKLTPENINDPSVALNMDNLEALCKNCHLKEHRAIRWRVDEMGHVTV